jgi:hypothetical protein
MNAYGDFMEMAKRVIAVEVKVDHLTEQLEATNNTIEEHSIRTDRNFEEIGKAISQQKDDIKRITIWIEAVPKLFKVFIAVVLTAALISSNGWKLGLNLIMSFIK